MREVVLFMCLQYRFTKYELMDHNPLPQINRQETIKSLPPINVY